MKGTMKRIAATLCMVLTLTNLSVFAEAKANRMSLSKDKVEMKVGNQFTIRSDSKAKVRVLFSLEKAKKGISVTTKDSEVLKITKLNANGYRVVALKKGKANVVIKSEAYKSLSKTLKVVVKEAPKAKPMVHLTSDSFEQEILEYKGKAIIYFGADWCPYCRTLEPIFEDARKKVPEYKFCMVNTDEEKNLAFQHGIRRIPIMIIYENGELITEDGYYPGMTSDDLASRLK